MTTTQITVPKYPPGSFVTLLSSTVEIKQAWLYSEWALECQFSQYIRPYFPDREDLAFTNLHPNVALIKLVFDTVRGKYILWQEPREEARWKKIVVEALPLEWVERNVEVLYPSKECFLISELRGIVLWNDRRLDNIKKYKLYEGNHRISAWISSQTPLTLPAVIYIGKPRR